MSFFKKIGKALKKVAPIALPIAASFIPGIGPALGKVASTVGGFLGMGGGSSSEPTYSQDGPGGVQQMPPTQVSPPWYSQVPWGAMASAGSAAMGYFGQQQTNAANAQMAQQQMDFQRQMSNTSYQRGTADMASAGLNPMLAYSQGGASSPGGATAQMGNELGGAVSSALQGYQTMATVDNIMSQTDRTHAESNNLRAETANILARLPQIEQQTRTSSAEQANIQADTERAKANLVSDIARGQYESGSLMDRLRQTKAESKITQSAVPAAEKAGAFADSPLGWLGPVLNSARQGAQIYSDVRPTGRRARP